VISFGQPSVELPPALDPREVADDLGPYGVVAAEMAQYEDRPTQRDMARTIAELYNDGGVGLLEAGTGVGKSLGYLLPALRWSALTGELTVVSTNTINLQEQLVRKDLPFLSRALGDEQNVRFAILKGWRNYLCLLRMEQAKLLEGDLFDDEQNPLGKIFDWSKVTTEGSIGDLPEAPAPEVWDEVAAEPDLCIRNECPHFDRCFLFSARRAAAKADVVVVNHHLLMSDVAVRRAQKNWNEAAVIPAYTRLVIDEGHHLEDAAAAHLGESATRRGLQRLMSRLSRPSTSRGRGRGILVALDDRLRSREDMFSKASLDLLQEKIIPAVSAARDHGEVVFNLLEVFLRRNDQPCVRLTDDFETDDIWRMGLSAALSDLFTETAIISDSLDLIRKRMESEEPLRDEATSALFSELRGIVRRLEGLSIALHGALDPGPDGPKRVRWVETRGRDGNVAVTWVPLDLAPILRANLFERVTTAIVTSATLATDSRFEFLASRLGVDQLDIPPIAEAFASPFDFATQSVIAIPTDVPAPNADGPAHFAAVVDMIADFAEASDGGLFALFTSHRDVQEAARVLRSRGMADARPLLVHGEEGRDALLERFRASGRAVLLGTSSYWEGVDVPGHALRGLLIARLPFRVPTEPVTAANCEAIVEKGGDPFVEYMVPHAALRLKQGFGRLIRTKTDRGAVIIADPRVIKRNYGGDLMRALPPARRLMLPWNEIARQLKDFYSVSHKVP
jgi:ATP-dependent DNA helicase DinG